MSRRIDNEEDLEKTLAANNEVMVLFYASWCPYCVQFLPVFEKYAAADANRYFRVVTDSMDRCEDRYSIDIVPTVLFFKNGAVAQRLDGAPGKGLNEKQLAVMIDSCKATPGK